MFGTREIIENDGVVLVDAPNRAEDAAVVPVTVRIPPTVKGACQLMTLIIDKNPSPVAATFTFGPAAGEGGGERRIVDPRAHRSLSYVRGIVETADGKLHMTKVFVMGAGGCSACRAQGRRWRERQSLAKWSYAGSTGLSAPRQCVKPKS